MKTFTHCQCQSFSNGTEVNYDTAGKADNPAHASDSEGDLQVAVVTSHETVTKLQWKYRH